MISGTEDLSLCPAEAEIKLDLLREYISLALLSLWWDDWSQSDCQMMGASLFTNPLMNQFRSPLVHWIITERFNRSQSVAVVGERGLLLYWQGQHSPVFCGGCRQACSPTIIIIRDNRLLSLQVIKPSRCRSQEKHINLLAVGKQSGPIPGLTSFCWGRLRQDWCILLFS